MKKYLFIIPRCILGWEYGFSGEGNEQWYYFLSLVMNLMLVWWLEPEIAILFTILAVIHYLTIFIYGFFDLDSNHVSFAYIHFGIHCILLILAFMASFKWAIITMAITIVSFCLAPDCTGNNIFLRKNFNKLLPLLFNAIILIAFIVIDFLLPIKLWIKLVIIISALIIHPIIDFLEGECVIISDVTYDAFTNIKDSWF